jgi:hypothetical protein
MLGLQTFAENVSVVDGPPVRAVGVTFTTRMIIVKLADGSLWVNSPVSEPFEECCCVFNPTTGASKRINAE